MATDILYADGTPVVWADTTDYSSTLSGLTRTHQIDLTSVAAAAARQGAKADLGATRAMDFVVLACMEPQTAPGSGETIEIYWAASPHTTAGNANPGGTSGADAAYTGTAGDSLADSLLQLDFIGSLVATSDAAGTPQYQQVGVLHNIPRYGMPVVFNDTAVSLNTTDAVEMFIALLPLKVQSQ
jgi:hypothetical protein